VEAANRELEAFSYSVAHDLRAPLRAINGYATLLNDTWASRWEADAQRLLGKVLEGSRTMDRLIADLLRLSRIGRQAFTRAHCNMRALVEELVAELRDAEPGRQVEVRMGDLPAVEGDAALLRHVFTNLLSNAFKFTRGREPGIVEVGCERQDGALVYFVRDNGAGFDMKYADNLFGPFQRLHDAHDFEGTGIGLSIAQRVVQRHGGRIRAEAQVDRGATFYVSLPAEGVVKE
jgi:light-regulated signal transduction histidine kinase (bacteriophytochrome)